MTKHAIGCWVSAGALCAGTVLATGPAALAGPPKPAPTHITVTPTAAVVLVKSTVTINATVTPVGYGALQLQVEHGTSWKTVATNAGRRGGTFAFAYHAAPTATTTHLRVYRPAVLAVVSAGFSPTISILRRPSGSPSPPRRR